MSDGTPVRRAGASDLERLLELMAEFYAESGHELDRHRAAEAFSTLLDDPRLGRVWVVEREAATVGYVVVTFVFAMEHGGTMAIVDDFFVRPDARGAGLGTALLLEVRRACAVLGARAMRVEVGRDNSVAQAVYRRAGFRAVDHQLMTLAPASSEHIV